MTHYSAYLTLEDGTQEPVTLRAVDDSSFTLSLSDTYHSRINTATQDSVTATVTLYWADGSAFGGVSGSWAALGNADTLSNQTVTVQGRGFLHKGEVYTQSFPGETTFEISADTYEDGWRFYNAVSQVTINDAETLTVQVSNSPFFLQLPSVSGPAFTWMQCSLVALGVLLALVTLTLGRKKNWTPSVRTRCLTTAVLCVLVGELFLWFW